MGTIGAFGDAVRSWGIVDSEMSNRPSIFEVIVDGFACELAASVGSQNCNPSTSLDLYPSLELFVVVEDFRFML